MKIPKIIYWLACFFAASNIIDLVMWFAEGGYELNPWYIVNVILSVAAWAVLIMSDVDAKKKFLHLAIGCAVVITFNLLIVVVAMFAFAASL